VPYESAKIYSVHVVAEMPRCRARSPDVHVVTGELAHSGIVDLLRSNSRGRFCRSVIASRSEQSKRLTTARERSWSCLTLRGSRGVYACACASRVCVCVCVCVRVCVCVYTRERRSHDWTGSQRRVSLLSARSYIFTFQRRRTTGG